MEVSTCLVPCPNSALRAYVSWPEISKVGGRIFVQDQASSVVWGMPGIVYREGLAEEALPLDVLAATITAVLSGNK